ncbi:TPA: hypothetical protein HA251_08215 [Candidatus Woesearchaeota archaeon]|nr:hypothetical protein [Candidatus Woesearchaeota archaeon]
MAVQNKAATANGPDIITIKDLLSIWRNDNYYNGVTKRKTFDVVLGTVWTIATIFLQMTSMSAAYELKNAYGRHWFDLIIPFALFIIWGLAIILSGIGRRKYLLMGLLFIPAFGLLFFGTCLLTLSANAVAGGYLIDLGGGPSVTIAIIAVSLISLGILIYGISKSIQREN